MKKLAHISIDDVIFSLRWITRNKPSSIFDTRLFGALKAWNERYGASFSLYVFEQCGDFCLADIPKRYYDDFHSCSSWLKFGFHGKSHEQCQFSLNEMQKSYIKTCNAVTAIAGSGAICKCLRLHKWSASADYVKWLRNQGVSALLCSDNDTPSYDLSFDEYSFLTECDKFKKNGLEYIKTHLRYEKTQNITEKLNQLREKPYVTAFTHELLFDSIRDNIESSIELLTRAGFGFCAY